MSVNRGPQKAAEEALSVLLQHQSFDTDSSLVCSISGVCRSWQAVVQQLQAGQLIVNYEADSQQPAKSMSRLTSMIMWLSKYPNLVGSLDVELPDDKDLYEAVEQLLALGLKQTTAVDCSTSSTSRKPRQLQLRHLTLTLLARPRLLTAFPASSLTSLNIAINEDLDSIFKKNAAWGTALGAFTGLQGLVLTSNDQGLPVHCFDHLSALSQLTSLVLYWVQEAGLDSLRQMPASLQELVLAVDLNEQESDRVVSIKHLTALTQLSLESCGTEPLLVGGALPENLQVLRVGQHTFEQGNESDGVASLLDLQLTKLQHLRELCLSCVVHDSSTDLLPIAGMTALQHLELWYDLFASAATAAPAWKQLPQLQRIRIRPGAYEGYIVNELGDIMEQLGAATSLTSLQLKSIDSHVGICRHITGLSRLQKLVIEYSIRHADDENPAVYAALVQDDVVQLSGLSALTHLQFGPVYDPDPIASDSPSRREGMGDMAAVALACQLTNLRHWNLSHSSLTTAAVVPAISLHLKHLTELDLRDNDYKFSDREVSRLLSYIPRLRVHV